MSEIRRTPEHFFRASEIDQMVCDYSMQYKKTFTPSELHTLVTVLHSRLNALVRESGLDVPKRPAAIEAPI